MKKTLTFRVVRLASAILVLSNFISPPACCPRSSSRHDPQKTRADYVARMQQQTMPPPADMTLGSLWTSERRDDQFAV